MNISSDSTEPSLHFPDVLKATEFKKMSKPTNSLEPPEAVLGDENKLTVSRNLFV